jgi:arylsulfatase A-like enzyme
MEERPHILIVMTDQQRADCLRCAGHPLIQTPNLDRIAREGVRFTQAVTAAPLCMPARASFATGLYPHNHGVWRNEAELPESQETLFQLLQRSGYFTALVGKGHYYQHNRRTDLRTREPFLHACGFTYVHETAGPGASVRTKSYVADEWERKGLMQALIQLDVERRNADEEAVRPSPLPVDDYLDSYIGRKAVEFVDAYADPRPLCLSVGFAGPHDPWDAPGVYATMYRPQDTPPPIPVPAAYATLRESVKRKKAFQVWHAASLALVPQIRANYYGKISLIDDRIGRILEAFQRKGWLDDLLIVFLADHGEMLGDHGRFRKGTFHESAIRIPLIVRWPGRIPANTVSDALAEIIDVFPTVLEAAGCAASPRCLGQSLWPVLRQPDAELRDSQLSECGEEDKEIMLRTRRYKLVVDGERQAYMLYDLEQDPDEQSNLAGDATASGLERALQGQLQAHLERAGYRLEPEASGATPR